MSQQQNPISPPSLYKTPLTYYSINSTHRTSMEEMERDIFGSNSYYTILGVCSDSSPEEIRSAYRRLAMVTFATHFSLNLFWKYQMPIMFDLCSDGIQIGGREEGLPLLCWVKPKPNSSRFNKLIQVLIFTF